MTNHDIKYIRIAFIILLGLVPIFGQLSPGDLNPVHKDLEGLRNCTSCHEQRKRLSIDKCLDCHTFIKQQRKDGSGLHASEKYDQCESCHVEHRGKADLIHWDIKREKFDHKLTKFDLKGKHKGKECRLCHTAKYISSPEALLFKKKDLERTFLGLDQNCISCHEDEHNNQLIRDCESCHNEESFKPAVLFNHSKSAYPLLGKHKDLSCEKCHKPIQKGGDKTFIQYKNISHNDCKNCHDDYHKGRFLQACSECHTVSGWKKVNVKTFDHRKTHYPLEGRHIGLSCEKCHPKNQPKTTVLYDQCTHCHEDYHQGQIHSEKRCEDCHTVQGFKPANFTLKQHQVLNFPITGVHLAIPCISCHQTLFKNTPRETLQFRFSGSNCETCHENIHGKLSKFPDYPVDNDRCLVCHSDNSWNDIHFDHKLTKFPLIGKHESTSCIQCHKRDNDNKNIPFNTLKMDCENCHKDIHKGQFINNIFQQKTECQRCHSNVDWLADKFNHEKDSNFSLKGGHQYLACSACHKSDMIEGTEIIRYKPLNSKCESCHKTSIPLSKEK